MINIKHFPFYLGLSFTFASALILCQLPASAQRGNQSDVTGAIVTTSDITGGTFSGNQSDVTGASVTTSDITSGIFSPSSARGRSVQVEFTKSSVRVAVNQTAGKIVNQLNRNAITSAAGNPIPSGTQQTLLSLLTASGSVQASGLTNTLTSVQGGPPAIQAQQLANSLQGLFKTNRANANGRVNPNRLVAAVTAYNNLIDNSSAQFLNNPPPELQAIQTVLLQLINSVSSQPR